MSIYTDFVKENYSKVKHLPNKERMGELAKMWRDKGHTAAKPAKASKTIAPRTGKKAKGGVLSGAGFLSDILGSVGL